MQQSQQFSTDDCRRTAFSPQSSLTPPPGLSVYRLQIALISASATIYHQMSAASPAAHRPHQQQTARDRWQTARAGAELVIVCVSSGRELAASDVMLMAAFVILHVMTLVQKSLARRGNQR